MLPRACGTCNLCCNLLRIKELRKPEFALCSFWDKERHCTIYDKKPMECSRFKCLWLKGVIPSSERPDRTGIIIYAAGTAVYFLEEKPDLAVLKYSRAMVEIVTKGTSVIIINKKKQFIFSL